MKKSELKKMICEIISETLYNDMVEDLAQFVNDNENIEVTTELPLDERFIHALSKLQK